MIDLFRLLKLNRPTHKGGITQYIGGRVGVYTQYKPKRSTGGEQHVHLERPHMPRALQEFSMNLLLELLPSSLVNDPCGPKQGAAMPMYSKCTL